MANTMPDTIVAGTTTKFTAGYGDFPANAGWSAVLWIVGAQAISAAATASGASFAFTVSAAATAGAIPGNYSWEVRATNASSGEVYIADSGTVEITPNLSTATTLLSWAATTHPLVEAAITALVSGNVASYQIGNRSFVKQDLDKLLKLKSYCESKLRAEKSPGSFLDTIAVKFADPDA